MVRATTGGREGAKLSGGCLTISVQDRIVSGEYRWQTIGIAGGLLLMVAHTVRDENDTEIVRIISARHVEPKERRRYERG